MSSWHVWFISMNRSGKIKNFLDTVKGVSEVLYPTLKKDYSNKKGEIKVRESPLYANYLFIKHDLTNEILAEIKKCPWIHDYVGKCSLEEIQKVKSMNKSKYDDVVSSSQIEIGSVVKLISTPFRDMNAVLVNMDGNKLSVSVNLFGSERIIKCTIDDIEIRK